MPMPRTRPRPTPGVAQQLVEARVDAASIASGGCVMSKSNARSASGVAGEVADRDAAVGRVEVGDKHDAGGTVEG